MCFYKETESTLNKKLLLKTIASSGLTVLIPVVDGSKVKLEKIEL